MTLFGLAIAAGIILIVLAILAWSGAIIGHHGDGPLGLENFKHGLLLIVLGIIALVFAAATRPTTARR